MKARLLCRIRPGETRPFELSGEQAVLGRDGGVEVDLPFEEVSRRHARISWDGRQHWLEDLQSTNGTFVNGRRVGKEREKLRHLSVLTLGKTTDLVFVIRGDETQTLLRTVIAHAFLVRDGVADALPYEVPVGEFSVGRSATCNLVSECADISKVHARLLRSADKLVVLDLGSANGTSVNGARVSEAALRDGDLVSFAGEAYRVSVSLGQVTSATTALKAGQVAAAAQLPARGETRRFSTDWKLRAMGPVERAAAAPLAPVGEATHRGAVPERPQSEASAAGAGHIQVRLTGAGLDLAVTGGGSYTIGSGASAPLRVEQAHVAPAHARLIVSDALGSVFIQRDEGSTLRNGRELFQPEPLLDGDVLGLGQTELKVAIRRVE